MKQISALLMALGIVPATTVRAQKQPSDSTLHRTVVVENQYNPQVMDAFKVNVLPKMEETHVPREHITYASQVRPFTAWPFMPMEAVTPVLKRPAAPKGYARLAYGNRNNLDARLSYLWDLTPQDTLRAAASLYGFDGSLPSAFSGQPDWDARFFRTDASLDYNHRFRTVSLSAGGDFASQVFNYMPAASHQRYTLAGGYAGISSVDDELPVRFALTAGVHSFASAHALPDTDAGSELQVHTGGYLAGVLTPGQCVGVGVSFDHFGYRSATLTDFALLQLNPYYTLAGEALRLRLGAHVDWQSANGSGLKVAPDVRLDYTFADTYTLYLQAEGGATPHGFRSMNTLSPYVALWQQMRTSYTLADAEAGLKASPLPGLAFSLFGGYRITKNEVGVLPLVQDAAPIGVPVIFSQGKVKVATAGASLQYDYKDRFGFSVRGAYRHWSVDDPTSALLYLKPRFELDASARSRVWRQLYAAMSYRYARRTSAAGLPAADAENNLSLWAGYEFARRINVFVRFNNVLCSRYITAEGYPMQGFYAMGGLSIRF